MVFYIMTFSLLSWAITGEIDNLPDWLSWTPICAYVLFFHCYLNQTPGMRVVGTKFVNSDSSKLYTGK